MLTQQNSITKLHFLAFSKRKEKIYHYYMNALKNKESETKTTSSNYLLILKALTKDKKVAKLLSITIHIIKNRK